VHERTAALSDVTRVHDAGDHIRVELDNGTFWEVGKGLGVPRRVHEWVARRIALLSLTSSLPSPLEKADTAFDAGQLDEARRRFLGLLARTAPHVVAARCSDVNCIGFVGPNRRCKFCGRPAEPGS
jgi:hypothetical protein